MQYSILSIKETVGDFRIDAEAYHPKYLHIETILERKKHTTLRKETKLFAKGIFDIKAECYLETGGIPFIRIGDLGDILLNDNYARIPEIENEKNNRTFLKKGDLVISKTAYPAASLVSIDLCNVSQDIIAIKLKDNSTINSHYLATFLNCKYGFLQMQRWFSGNIQAHLNLSDSSSIKIPVLDSSFQTSIEKHIEQALEYKTHSYRLYLEAEQILLSELGLVDWKPKHQLSFIKKFSDSKNADRIDAEYFQPMYDDILAELKSHPHKKLKDITTLVGHPTNPPYETEAKKNKTFILTQKHLSEYFPSDNFWEDHEALYTTEDFINKNKGFLLRNNDIILYSVGAYIGKANIYLSSIPATIGSFLTLIRPNENEINPYYLLVFLNSTCGKELTRRCSRGLAQQYIYPFDIREFIIPIISKHRQQAIETMMLEAQKGEQQSKKFLDIVKRGVELAIEQGEEEAQNWINEELETA